MPLPVSNRSGSVMIGSCSMSAPSEGITCGPELPALRCRCHEELAAFICCPLAGAILLAVNYVRLGKTGKGILAVILGLLATALKILIIVELEDALGVIRPVGI